VSDEMTSYAAKYSSNLGSFLFLDLYDDNRIRGEKEERRRGR